MPCKYSIQYIIQELYRISMHNVRKSGSDNNVCIYIICHLSTKSGSIWHLSYTGIIICPYTKWVYLTLVLHWLSKSSVLTQSGSIWHLSYTGLIISDYSRPTIICDKIRCMSCPNFHLFQASISRTSISCVSSCKM